MTVQIQSHSQSRLTITGTLSHSDLSARVEILIDSGAEKSFISSHLINEYNLPTQPLDSPLTLLLADKTEAIGGPVSHRTLPLQLSLDNHLETTSLLIHSTLATDIILGADWLRNHNPSIDWSTHTISFPSDFCISTCCPPDSHPRVSPQSRMIEAVLPDLGVPAKTRYPRVETEIIIGTTPRTPDPSTSASHSVSIASISALTFSSHLSDTSAEIGLGGFVSFDSDDSPRFTSCANLNLEHLSDHNYPFFHPRSATDFQTQIPDYINSEFADVFSETAANTLPEHRDFDCAIDLIPGSSTPFGKIYNLTIPEELAMSKWLQKHTDNNFIRPSSSPYGAPCFFVKKKDGDLRLCVDYRALNQITKKDRNPIPLISDLIRSLSKGKFFIALDLRGAYNLLRIRKGDEEKTAFVTKFGQFEFLVMPFGLANAPAQFQKMMNSIFRPLLGNFVVVYLDDIVIYSQDPAEHESHVRQVLQI